MRIMVLAFMIFLLPLRGWMGDAMAMAMVPTTLHPTHHATKLVADTGLMTASETGFSVRTASSMPSDCNAHLSPDEHPSDGSQQDDDCSVSASCQICHSIALTAPLPLLAPARLPSAQPQIAARHYASAERTPGFKPPIS
jgi:hypothetical protein